MRIDKIIILGVFVVVAGIIFLLSYSIYNIVCTYKLDKSEKAYEYAIASIKKSRSRRGISYQYLIRLANDDKIHKKTLNFATKIDEKHFIPEENVYVLEVKFNDKGNYFIIKDHIKSMYATYIFMLLLAIVFIIVSIVTYLREKGKNNL